MTGSRTEQLAPLSGVASIVLLAASTLIFNFYEYLPDPAEIRDHLMDNATQVQVAGYVGILATFFFYWFASSLRSTLRAAEGGDGRASNISFGGAVGAATLMVATFSVLFASGARAGADSGISEIAAVASYDVYGTIFSLGVALGMGVMIAAFAVVAFRTGVVGRWLAWVSAFLALGSISPAAYIFVGLDAVWVLYVSVALYMAGRQTVSSPAPQGGRPPG